MGQTCPKCGYAEVETGQCPRCQTTISTFQVQPFSPGTEPPLPPMGTSTPLGGGIPRVLWIPALILVVTFVTVAANHLVDVHVKRPRTEHANQRVVAVWQSRDVVEQALRYQQTYGRNPGSITRLNKDLPDADVVASDPWGRPWVVSPAFQDSEASPNPGDLWVCSRGPGGTGPCPPANIPSYSAAMEDASIGYSKQLGSWQGSEAMFGRWLYGALMATPLLLVLPFAVPLGYVIWCGGTGRGLRRAAAKSSWSMLSLLCIVSLMSALAASCTEALLNAAAKSMPARAATDVKTAVTQAIVYAGDKGVYPRSMRGLRDPGYANIRDKDPWGNDWVFSPVLSEGRKPMAGDHVYVFSKGPRGIGRFPKSFTSDPGEGGSIGYSSIYGSWQGR